MARRDKAARIGPLLSTRAGVIIGGARLSMEEGLLHRSSRAFVPGASSRGLFLAAALLATIAPAHADVTLREMAGNNP